MITVKAAAVLAGIVFLSGVQVGVQMKDADREEIEKAVLQRHEEIKKAAQSLDVEKVYQYVLENDKGCIIQDGKLLLTRKDAMESTKNGFQGLQRVGYELEQQHVTVISPGVALLTAEGLSTATTKEGRSFSVRFAQSVLFVCRDKEWKVLHAHRSFPANR